MTKNIIFILLDLFTRLAQHKKGNWFKTVNSDSKRLLLIIALFSLLSVTILPFEGW